MMTSAEILGKAIDKAQAQGWDWDQFPADIWEGLDFDARAAALRLFLRDQGYKLFIFNHDFAKALWGDEPTYAIGFGKNKKQRYMWQHRLQQMVIATDPLEYLGANI